LKEIGRGLAGRICLKNNLIRNHLRNTIIIGIPMQVICDGAFFPGCRLRTLDDGSFGVTGPSRAREDSSAAFSYIIDGYVYGFETKTTGSFEPSTDAPMPLRLPERIVRIERRKSYRATCPDDEPVTVLVTSRGQETRADAIVISEESVGLSLPPETSPVAIDSTVSMTVSLPRLGQIDVRGTVRFVRDTSGSTGLVVRFDEVSDPDRALLQRYVRMRQIEEQAGDRGERREGGFLVTRRVDARRVGFWCPAQLLGSIDVLDEALEVVSVDALEYL
jgi:hypothetical protein